jgi:hypothetical protein
VRVVTDEGDEGEDIDGVAVRGDDEKEEEDV